MSGFHEDTMNKSTERKQELIKFLKRKGWMDFPFAHAVSSAYEPSEDEIAEILDLFFSFHAREENIAPTGLGGGFISEKKIFMISYKPLGWEHDQKEYYDTISKDSSGYQIIRGELIVTPSPKRDHQ